MKFNRLKEPSKVDEATPRMEQVFAVEISPEDASKQLIIMNTRFPLPAHLNHVKRIWRKDVAQDSDQDRPFTSLTLLLSPTQEEFLCEDWTDFLKDTPDMRPLGSVYETQVPSRMPQSRREFEMWRKLAHWPTAFHEPRAALREEAEELSLIESLGPLVIPRLLAREKDDSPVIIVDPRRPTDEHWVTSWGKGEHVLAEPVMQAIQTMAGQHLALEADPVRSKDIDRPYLCTGFIAFCRREPSVMSAMALVHSRIKSVVFIEPDEQRGGLLSRLQLQFVRETNHHFSVYQCHLSSL